LPLTIDEVATAASIHHRQGQRRAGNAMAVKPPPPVTASVFAALLKAWSSRPNRETTSVAVFYREVIDGVPEHWPAEYVRRPNVPTQSRPWD
jgi:hypothetical protein